MYGGGRRSLIGWAMLVALSVANALAAQNPRESASLREAEQLAWSKHFAEAERMYRRLLQESPHSRDVRIGLAHVLLWEGRYREARAMFLQLVSQRPGEVEAAEGAATAAYWQGDFRTAAHEFRAIAAAHPGRTTAVQSLREITLATAGNERFLFEAVDDDQPYRLWRSAVEESIFSDPLTRWDVRAGFYRADNPTLALTRNDPFVTLTNELVLPWQRLTITTTAGALRWPDGTTRPIGGVAVQFRTSPASSIRAAIDHHELLRTATAIRSHPAVTQLSVGWSRYAENAWVAGAEAGSLQYFDRNRGWYAQGYGLWPLLRRESLTVWGGASAALHDTRDSRFYVEAISSERSGSEFLYSYRGAYTPYWTPQRLAEARAIVSAMKTVARNVTLKAQIEAGVARDRARAFGPSEGPSPFPPSVLAFDFNRTFHPTRLSIAASVKVAPAYTLELNAARETTVFYRANEFQASLVRHH